MTQTDHHWPPWSWMQSYSWPLPVQMKKDGWTGLQLSNSFQKKGSFFCLHSSLDKELKHDTSGSYPNLLLNLEAYSYANLVTTIDKIYKWKMIYLQKKKRITRVNGAQKSIVPPHLQRVSLIKTQSIITTLGLSAHFLLLQISDNFLCICISDANYVDA